MIHIASLKTHILGSLRTADAFPVVASLPSLLCCSHATFSGVRKKKFLVTEKYTVYFRETSRVE